MSQKFEKLKTLLKELFQLDQPDLDFGVYRVMHARSGEITQFLEEDLLPQVRAAFEQYRFADKAAIQKDLAEAIAQAEKLGADPETLPKVKDLRARLAEEAVDLGALEAEVYDHLYNFFSRYYSEGDFISQRRYKEGVYAIPYEGEEVKLYWANYDQYYIKTSEYLRDYAFRLRPDNEKNPMRVRFQIVDAAEGEHGNVQEGGGRERRFMLAPEPFAAFEDGELVIRFTYGPDPRKRKQKDLNAEAEAAILGLADPTFADWIRALGKSYGRADGTLSVNTCLRVHLDRYTARNTFDYFIHKDLGGFLRRELDFYIKNEVMHLDDIESETAPRVEQYLSKIKVIRKIASKIIDFLAQLEDFQKKLWLKKKFVTETSWCIRLGVIPEEFYPEIAANDALREEWVQLCAIDELKPKGGTLFENGAPAYSEPLTVEFLKAHPTLMVDTRHFDAAFAARLLDAIGDVDEYTDGLIVHGENFQALRLVHTKYKEQVDCIYIDPPYNTQQDRATGKFLYKDSYENSSWLSMMESRIRLGQRLLSTRGSFFCSIDENEVASLDFLLKDLFGPYNVLTPFKWKRNRKAAMLSSFMGTVMEFLLVALKCRSEAKGFCWGESTDKTRPVLNAGNPVSQRVLRAGIDAKCEDGVLPAGEYGARTLKFRLLDEATIREGKLQNDVRVEGRFRVSQEILDRYAYITRNKALRRYVDEEEKKAKIPLDLIDEDDCRNETAKEVLDAMFGESAVFTNPKPPKYIANIIRMSEKNVDPSGDRVVLDFFAGSGTTGHAIINLNREDGGQRKFILVEQGDYFDTVLLPRLKKVTFSPEWKDGKPKRLAKAEEAERSPRIMKVVLLESYEDTLNNLELKRAQPQQSLLDLAEAQGPGRLREQYILRYMLDVETRSNQSLLNVGAFTDPTAYRLKVKRPGSDETRAVNIDLVETFNWLIGLTVEHMAAPQTFAAEFERDGEGRLRLKGRLKQEADGRWWFRAITGTTRDGRKTLVIWRKRPGGEEPEGIEKDNLVLDEWFTKQVYSSKDSEFDLIYVNGDNNLENLKTPDDTWKVRLIEEDFLRLIFETEVV